MGRYPQPQILRFATLAQDDDPRPRLPYGYVLASRRGVGGHALDLDDHVAERSGAGVLQAVPDRAVVPAHQLAGLDRDRVDAAVVVRPLDLVAVDHDGGVVEQVRVEAGHLAGRKLDAPDPD